jgi:hypothetical protein
MTDQLKALAAEAREHYGPTLRKGIPAYMPELLKAIDKHTCAPSDLTEALDKEIAWRMGVQATAAREKAELVAALREIAIGKLQVDNEHPLGPWFSMAARYTTLARAALEKYGGEK